MAVLSIEERNKLLAQSGYGTRGRNTHKSNKLCNISKSKTPPKKKANTCKGKSSNSQIDIVAVMDNVPDRVSAKEFRELKSQAKIIIENSQNNPHQKEIDRMNNSPELIQKDREHYEQVLYFSWLYINQLDVHDISCATPNGGNRQRFEGVRLNAEGLKRGWPDTQMLFPASGYHGLFIEFKKPVDLYKSNYEKTHAVKEHQIDVLLKLQAKGYACFVAFGHEEAISIVNAYLNNKLDSLDLFFNLNANYHVALN